MLGSRRYFHLGAGGSVMPAGGPVQRGFSDRVVLELVETVYAAGCNPQEWPNFVARVHALLPGAAFSVHLGIEGTRIDANSATAGIPNEFVASYVAHYQFMNPYNKLFEGLPVGKVFTVPEVVAPGWIDRQVFYHEWLKPAGDFTRGAALVVARDRRRLMRVSFDMPSRYEHLEPPCAQLLERLGPHIARSLELNERLEAALVAEQTLSDILERIDGPAVLLTEAGRVLALNRAAEQAARAQTLLEIGTDNRLRFRDAAHNECYERGLAAAFRPLSGDANAFAIGRSRASARTAVVLPLRPVQANSALCPPAPRALLLIRDRKAAATPTDLLRAVYRLTKAEAEIVSLIASGIAVSEAADALAITRATARNQLAAAMAKMDVHRQGELVVLVAGLTPRLMLASRM